MATRACASRTGFETVLTVRRRSATGSCQCCAAHLFVENKSRPRQQRHGYHQSCLQSRTQTSPRTSPWSYWNQARHVCDDAHDARRRFTTSAPPSNASSHGRTPTHQRAAKLASSDRGPKPTEDTVTDFSRLDVLGAMPHPSTSVDVCSFDGFSLDSGLHIGDGDGVILLGQEAFVWRPWMAAAGAGAEAGAGGGAAVVTGTALRRAAGRGAPESARTGGVLNAKGQFEIADKAWGTFSAVSPRPDLLIIGTGPSIRPLAPQTRTFLEQLGVRIEVLDTRNAASQFNLLATERGVDEVAAALLPIGFGVP